MPSWIYKGVALLLHSSTSIVKSQKLRPIHDEAATESYMMKFPDAYLHLLGCNRHAEESIGRPGIDVKLPVLLEALS
jgi:hypothetical protein